MYDTPRTTKQLLTLLAATPTRLTDLTEVLSPAQLMAPPEPGEWSARDVLAHLRACSDMWGNYIAQILTEDKPTFKAVNPTTWIKQTDYLEQEFQPSLRAFTKQRAELLAVLKPLTPEAWSRSAMVTGGGKPRERTVYTYAQWLANHELSHIKQIERIASAVGMSSPRLRRRRDLRTQCLIAIHSLKEITAWKPNPKPPSSSSSATTTGPTRRCSPPARSLPRNIWLPRRPAPTALSTHTLGHIIAAEADYVGRMTGNGPQPPFQWEDEPALADISAFAGQVAGALLDVVQRVPPTTSSMRRRMAIPSTTRPASSSSRSSTTASSTAPTSPPSSAAWVFPAPEVDGWGYLFSHREAFELKEGLRKRPRC